MDTPKHNIFLTPVEYLKGIGPRRAQALKTEKNVYNAADLINNFPFTYIHNTK